jgi:glycosyltransferase involved in cell wall biosynthesis
MEFTQKESRIRYVRLSSKGGFDQDFDRSVELARGEYCWLFTDDDLLKPGAVAAVKEAIKNGVDLVVVNAELRNRDLSVLLERRRIIMQENKVYAPGSMEHLFSDALDYLSFIGAVVIRRSIWLSREKELYFGTEFVHVGVIFQKPLPGPALIIAEPYIIIRFGNAQWTPRSFDIWMFKWPRLVWSFNDISDGAKRSVSPREPWRDIRKLFFQRSEGGYNLEIYRKYFSSMRVDVLWKICALMVACFPRRIIVGFHYLYSRRKPESRASFDDFFAKSGR